jgi:hypothetical protein
MEGAGKLVDSDELRDAMAGKGLGTPATRAAIIEGLLTEKYLLREGREMIPTAKAFQLMTLLRGLGVNELTAPELTGEWEYKLSQMEKGKISREEFMREIAQMTQIIVKRAKEYNNDTIPGDYATLKTPCPNCAGVVKENYRRFACTKCDFSMSKTPGSRQFEIEEVEELLKNRTIGPLQGFRSKMGRPFAAILRIVRDEDINNFKLEFDFGQDQEEGEDGEGVDFTGQTPLGPCPKCNGGVYEMGLAYVCEHQVAKPKTCDFRSGRIILQQEILPEQMAKLLNDGKTDLLPGFVSQRTRRAVQGLPGARQGRQDQLRVRGAQGQAGRETEGWRCFDQWRQRDGAEHEGACFQGRTQVQANRPLQYQHHRHIDEQVEQQIQCQQGQDGARPFCDAGRPWMTARRFPDEGEEILDQGEGLTLCGRAPYFRRRIGGGKNVGRSALVGVDAQFGKHFEHDPAENRTPERLQAWRVPGKEQRGQQHHRADAIAEGVGEHGQFVCQCQSSCRAWIAASPLRIAFTRRTISSRQASSASSSGSSLSVNSNCISSCFSAAESCWICAASSATVVILMLLTGNCDQIIT